MKYKYPEGDYISGFGGDYEKECQAMVIRGMEWFDNNSPADPKFRTIKNVYGVIEPTNDEGKDLEKAIIGDDKRGMTGAMVQAAISHTFYAIKNGWEKYIEEITKPKDNDK